MSGVKRSAFAFVFGNAGDGAFYELYSSSSRSVAAATPSTLACFSLRSWAAFRRAVFKMPSQKYFSVSINHVSTNNVLS